ncbi:MULTISPECIES: MIP/aquaporin family protein [Pontibacillus]|uniref:MIP/aquaporin family protein n=1 Tax=Pontibacillus chungwhensis TaxID=265426 RepID=A0ABY8UW90_9BACI|nr:MULTISPECIES: MIP/aquaporin family protein [Pontibacillus]MCD5325327.1 aquaporin family protein [Pontibacillus sp. HN14]WIF97568.1 MIP/aquaporin family protein [Pontibacillus chungwhensis]
MTEFIGELIGTMILIIFGGGVVGGVVLKGSKAEGTSWVLISIGWGLAVTFGVYAVGQVSGAHINPAVTLGFAMVGDFPWSKVPKYLTAQFLGAFLGAIIVFFHYLPHWKATEDKGAKLAVFSTDPAIRSPLSNLVSEIIGTFMLVMGLLFIGANDFTEGLNPAIVGLLITAIGMSLGGTTGYAINPARDIGPRIAHYVLPIPGKGTSDWRYAWVPFLGPIIGGIYGGLFYKAIFVNDLMVAFWVFTVIILVIFLTAARIELKKANSKDVQSSGANA